jgi:CBS domain-containing protein
MKKRTVADIMTRETVTLSPTDTVHEAAARLAQHRISGAPVVDQGELVGILSEADLMHAAIPPASIEKTRSTTMAVLGLFLRGQATVPGEDATVGSVMTDDVVTIGPTTSIWDAAAVMERRRLKRLPVVDDEGDLIGIISRADLVAAMARTDEELREDVLDAISIAGEESVKDVDVEINQGSATLTGTADRKTTKDLALKLAAQVPGILEVVDRLAFEADDTKEIPRQKDPWAVGPLVKDQ